MQCNSCGSEWNSKVKSEKCPFCGEPLVKPQNICEVLRFIVDTYGIEIYDRPNAFIGLINDCLPNASDESRLIKICFDSGFVRELLYIKKEDCNELNIIKMKVSKKIQDHCFINKIMADKFVDWILYSLRIQDEQSNENNDTQQVVFEEKYDSAMNYLNEKKYNEAIPLLLELSENGYAPAQNSLGICYLRGEGIEKNKQEGISLFLKAIEQDYLKSKINLARCYNNDNNFCEAITLYKDAAEQDDAYSQFKLGEYFLNGYGTEKNIKEAIVWLTKAAEQEHHTAQMRLALIFDGAYENLLSEVDVDYCESFKWYKRLAEKGDAISQFKIGECYLNGKGVLKDSKKAIEWFFKSSEQNCEFAHVALGECYRDGNGVTKDYSKALWYFKKAADLNLAAAQIEVGHYYRQNAVDVSDFETALSWYKKAADQGDKMGILLFNALNDTLK